MGGEAWSSCCRNVGGPLRMRGTENWGPSSGYQHRFSDHETGKKQCLSDVGHSYDASYLGSSKRKRAQKRIMISFAENKKTSDVLPRSIMCDHFWKYVWMQTKYNEDLRWVDAGFARSCHGQEQQISNCKRAPNTPLQPIKGCTTWSRYVHRILQLQTSRAPNRNQSFGFRI